LPSSLPTICDRDGLPIAVHVASASPYEPHLVTTTLDARFFLDLPWCLIGDRGYDSDGLDDLLMTQYGIEMIAANRRGRAKTQDGRPLRRAKRRWKIERLFAWLHNCRRVVTRWEPRRELPGHGAARLCPDLAPGTYEIASRS
jgi:transposase